MTDFKIETYYMFYDDDGTGCPSHSILVFYKNGKVFWFEPMLQDREIYYSGIHEYSDISSLLKDVKEMFIRFMILNKFIPISYDESRIYIYKYEKPSYHINGIEMREHINKSILCVL